MGMSTHVIGFRPPDDKFKKMKAIYDQCYELGVSVPDEVEDFFESSSPDDSGVEVGISEAIEPWQADMEDGYQVDLAKLPKDIRYIRFYNSY